MCPKSINTGRTYFTKLYILINFLEAFRALLHRVILPCINMCITMCHDVASNYESLLKLKHCKSSQNFRPK